MTRAAGRTGDVNGHRWQDLVRVHPASPDPASWPFPIKRHEGSRPACPEMVVLRSVFNEVRMSVGGRGRSGKRKGQDRLLQQNDGCLLRLTGSALRVSALLPMPKAAQAGRLSIRSSRAA
jgi:hypothetical protein